MQVHTMREENLDLRRQLHIKNAEKFIETRKAFTLLVCQVESLIGANVADDVTERFKAFRRKGYYYSVKGEQNFVRYAAKIQEINSSLRHLINQLQAVN